MIVMDNDGNLFDERRKHDRRQKNIKVDSEKRKEDRRKKNINEPKKRNQNQS